MNVIKCILIYPYVVLFDIIEFFSNLISNILYKIKKNQYKYDDIIAVEYNAFMPPDDDSLIIYNKGEYIIQNGEYDKIVEQDKTGFEQVINKLKENNILKYNNIFSIYITPFSELFCEDGGKGEEILTIYFKNNRKHAIRASRESKVFNKIVTYLYNI